MTQQATPNHNRTTMRETTLARGDHFFVWRQHNGVPFQHHAIDLGDGTVVHFTDGKSGVAGPGGATTDFEIQRTSLRVVTRDGRYATHLVSHGNRLSPETVVERALSQVGRRGYHLIFDNCEHFACWCVADREESRQVGVVCERISAAGVKAIAAGTVRVASKVASKHLLRTASPWMLASDAAQWITEAGGHHVGLRDPNRRKTAGRAVGMTTALGIGRCGRSRRTCRGWWHLGCRGIRRRDVTGSLRKSPSPSWRETASDRQRSIAR